MAEITSKITMSYLKNGAWKSFSSKIQSSFDGLKIQTTNSSYYLQYRTWNEGKNGLLSLCQEHSGRLRRRFGPSCAASTDSGPEKQWNTAGFRNCGDVPYLYGRKMAPLGEQCRPCVDGECAEKIQA